MKKASNEHFRWWHTAAASLAFVVALSFSIPATHSVWLNLDVAVFAALNGSMVGNEAAQKFWAFLSTRIFDVSAAVLMVLPFLCYMRSDDRETLIKRTAEGIYIAVLLTLTILISKEFSIDRKSPSFVLTPLVDISYVLDFAEAKVFSSASYPSDHGTATFLLSIFYWHFAGKKYGLFMLSLAALFCLPRLFAGAHWFSDIAAGSVVVTLIVVSLFVRTPIEVWGIKQCQMVAQHPILQRILCFVFLKR